MQACRSNKATGCKYLLLIIRGCLGYVVKGSFLLDAALQEKRIRGAALDVFETEPLPENSPLYELDNCLLSPHCADRTARSVLSYCLAIPTLQNNTAHHKYALRLYPICPESACACSFQYEATEQFVENLERFVKGEELFNVVDKKRGY